MKTRILLFFTITLLAVTHSLYAQGTAFTYQGRLNDGANPANGIYDLRFTIYDALTSGTQQGSLLTNSPVNVSNGLFTVTLDFGNQFPGAARWLEIGVRTNGGATFTNLVPRQKLTPVPYAITAGNLTGTLPASQLNGTLPSSVLGGTYSGALTLNNPANGFTGNGSGLANVNATALGGLAAANFWQTGGNAGTSPGVNFVGTTDNQPLTVRVNNTIALQFMPGITLPNVVGGLAGFRPSVIASGVSGAVIAGGNAPSGGVSGFGGGDFQAAYDNDGSIGGGFGNKVGSNNGDLTDAAFATVAGGVFNSAASYAATVAGGDSNLADGNRAAVLGGYANRAGGALSAVGGGLQNTIQTNATYAAIAGGQQNTILAAYSFIGSGTNNSIQSGAFDSSIAGGSQNSIQYGSYLDAGAYSFIGAGQQNTIEHDAEASVIAGGLNNTIQFSCQVATISGGGQNSINMGPGPFEYSTFSSIAGGNANGITGSSYAVIGGGLNNTIRRGSTYSTIAGGWNNSTGTNAQTSTISGGFGNFIQTNAQNAVIGGGTGNSCLGNIATVPGGYQNIAGFSSFAAGTQARAINDASFVWADNQGIPFSSTANNQVSFRCLGGVRFTSGGASANQTVSWTPGSASWSFSSDRNLKNRFVPVDTKSVLDKVSKLPLTEWSYIGYDQRHLGPMAQDFHAAFPLNDSTTTLNDADLHGVTLAAIQGLNQKVEDRSKQLEVRSQKLEAENAELKQRLEALEKLVRNQNSN